MYWKKFARGSRLFKCKILVVLVLIIFILVIVYWWALAPIISRFFVSGNTVYQGLEYYIDGNYLKFDDGATFQTVISDYDILKQGKPVDFYYYDNYVEDNPIYGKMSDVYALDLVYQEEEYLAQKRLYEKWGQESKTIGDYTFYGTVDTTNKRAFVKGIAFCDETFNVRCVLVTDLDTLFLISNVFDRNSNLEWSASGGQGDGSL